MSWNDFTKPAYALAAIALFGTAGTASAEVLIVRSTGPSAASYPPGRQLPDATKIALKANDMVVLLDGGGTRTLRGPGMFNAVASSGQASDTRTSFAALVTQRAERRARIGAVRPLDPASSQPARSPNIWYTDVRQSGRICMREGSDVMLWRPSIATPMDATITASDGSKATVSWERGQAAVTWPAAIKLVPQTDYTVSWKGAAKPSKLSFVPIGPDPAGLEDMASALIRNGCQAQLDLLIEMVALPDANPATAG